MSLTPNCHYQFLRQHSDNQKIFIYQLLGNKLWKIYQDEEGGDLTVLSNHIKHNDTLPYREIRLYKGEVLDIPVNVVHKAECTSSIPSVHLTFASPHIKNKSDIFHYLFSFVEKRMHKTHNFDEPFSSTDISESFYKDFQESITSLDMDRLILDYKQDRFLEAVEIFNRGYKYY